MSFPEVESNLLIHGRDDNIRVAAFHSKLTRETETGHVPKNRLVELVPIAPVTKLTLARNELPSSNPMVMNKLLPPTNRNATE